jgi:hypothetical protein
MSDNKIDQILEIVAKEKLTRSELVARIGTTAKSLASYFTSLRLVAKFSPEKNLCPDVDADGKIVLVPYGDYEARQQAVAGARTAKPPKTPREAYLAAEKTLQRAQKVAEGIVVEDKDDILGSLYKQRADINVKIAEIELAVAKEAFDAAPEEPVVDAEVEATPEIEEEME